MSGPAEIRPARDGADFDAARALFGAYQQAIGLDLGYQGFAAELAGLPGRYAPPAGELLLARGADNAWLGCVAMRPLEEAGLCEMKRLWVEPAGRGLGLGRALVAAILAAARTAGHARMRLDTLPSMASAIAVYRAFGFVEIAPYYSTPVAGTLFFEARL